MAPAVLLPAISGIIFHPASKSLSGQPACELRCLCAKPFWRVCLVDTVQIVSGEFDMHQDLQQFFSRRRHFVLGRIYTLA